MRVIYVSRYPIRVQSRGRLFGKGHLWPRQQRRELARPFGSFSAIGGRQPIRAIAAELDAAHLSRRERIFGRRPRLRSNDPSPRRALAGARPA